MPNTNTSPFSSVLIAGGAGFIGSHLCERFLALGARVTAVDNFFTGARANVEHLLANPRFTLTSHDIVQPLSADVDVILNFACPASPVHYQRDPLKTIDTSVLGTRHLLELARQRGARFVQASTSEVYGDPAVHPQPESYWGNVNPIGVRSCYDEGKRLAETLCFDYHRAHGVDIRVVRIFNTYGPRMAIDDGRVVSNFIVQALRGEDLTVYGSGEQTRSFCYVDDLVEAIMRFTHVQGATGPLNIGNDGEFTMLALADEVLRQVGGRSRVVHRPLPSDDPRCRRPDLTAARALLGWRPEVPLAAGVTRTIAYFRRALGRG